MNEIPPFDRPAAADHHAHEARIVRLEVNMDTVITAIKSLQAHTDEGFRSLTALINDLAKELRAEQGELRVEQGRQAGILAAHQTSIEFLRSEMKRLDGKIDRLDDKIDRLDAKLERMNRWMIGLFLANLMATVGMLARPYLTM